jgi:16S rRNA processing protein RimM
LTLVTAGRVGRAHGRDGSFWVDGAAHDLPEGTALTLAGRELRVDRRAGTRERPLIRLSGLEDPRPLRGEPLLADAELADDEWLAADLLGCEVDGLGRVSAILDAPSCALLELDDGTLVPFVTDAVTSVDVERRRIEVDGRFLGP